MSANTTLKRMLIPATVAAVAIGIATVPAATADHTGQATRCPAHLLIAIPGTTETSETADPEQAVGMLANVTNPLEGQYDADTFQTWYTPYMSVIVNDQAETYGTSKQQAIDVASQEIADRAAECPDTQFGLTGFSQGADAAGDLASQIGKGKGPVPASRIFAVGLMSDPGTQKGVGKALGAPTTGVGFAGARPGGFGELNDIAAHVCAKNDLYCNTPEDSIGTQFIGALGSSIDAQDPVKSVAGVVTTLLGINGVPMTSTLGALNDNIKQGNIAALPQLALDLSAQVSQLSAEVAGKAVPGSDTAALAASIAHLADAASRGDIVALPGILADLAPKVIAFASEVAKMVGELVSKLPINEYVAIGATVTRISANAAMQNYAALPLDLGKLVGQLNNAVRKTLRALPLDQFPMLNKMADELTPGRVLDEVLNYATFLAADTHNSYASTPINSSGRTGAEELVNYFSARIDNGREVTA